MLGERSQVPTLESLVVVYQCFFFPFLFLSFREPHLRGKLK